jgi:hypothetical protein
MKAQISPDMDHLPVVQTTPRYMEVASRSRPETVGKMRCREGSREGACAAADVHPCAQAEKIGGSEVSYTHASPSVRLAGSRSVPHTPGHADSEEGASPSQERRAFTEPRAERATHRRGADGASLEDMLQKSLDRLAALESERATRFRQCREEAMKHGMKMVEEEQRRRDMEHTVMMRRIQLLSDELQETKHALAQKEEECDELLEAAQELSVHGNADAERKDRACIRILPSVMPGSPSKKKTGLAGFFRSLGGACSSK